MDYEKDFNITLVGNGGVEIEVRRKDAELHSGFINDFMIMFECESHEDEQIKINIPFDSMPLIYLGNYFEILNGKKPKPIRKPANVILKTMIDKDRYNFIMDTMKYDKTMIAKLFKIADYLRIDSLMDLILTTIASFILRTKPEDMANKFNLDTPSKGDLETFERMCRQHKGPVT